MGKSFGVHVFETIKKLSKVVSGCTLVKSSSKGNKVEKFAASDKFQHDKLDVLGALLGIVLGSLANFNQIDNVGVVETLQRLDLRLDKFLELLVAVQNFNRISSA